MRIKPHIPNLITFSRICTLPLVVFFLLREKYLLALGLFILSCATDYVDGYLARKYRWESALGSILDPLCDKLFALTFFGCLLSKKTCPPWFMGLFIAVSLFQGIGIGILWAQRGKDFVLEPLKIGKWNTVLTFVWIGVIFADLFARYQFPRNFHYSPLFHHAGYLVLGIAQVMVFFRYFLRFRSNFIPRYSFTFR